VAQKSYHLLLAVILVDQVLLTLNDFVPLGKLLSTVLTTHVFGEVFKITACDVDHLLLAHLMSSPFTADGSEVGPITICRNA
jgi:hypothetical protein